jgi:4-carboxymuconolactone decarboxylase
MKKQPTRIGPIDQSNLSNAQRRVFETIVRGPRGSVRGPLALWLHRPALADHAQALGRYCRYESALPAHLSELAILVTAHCWQSAYEWQAHEPLARQAGLSQAVIEAIAADRPPPFAHEDEAAVHGFARMLHMERRVDDTTYERALAAIGQDRLIDLVGILGYYGLISMTINAFEIAPLDLVSDDDGQSPPRAGIAPSSSS